MPVLINTNRKNCFKYRSFKRYVLCDQAYLSTPMQRLLHDPDQGLMGTMLKVDTTTTVGITQIDGHAFVIKRYNIKGFWHGLKRSISRSRASKCWQSARRLTALKINTPRPVAMVEKRIGLLRRQAYYIYEYLEGTLASEVFTSTSIGSDHVQKQADQLAAQLKKMHRYKCTHGDTKNTNYIFVEDKPYIIDLDGMHWYTLNWPFQKKRTRELARFLRNWETETDVQALFAGLLEK